MMTNSIEETVSDRLLFIEIDQAKANEDDRVWSSVVGNLLKNHVDKIVFDFFPLNASQSFYEMAAQSGKVIFGRRDNNAGFNNIIETESLLNTYKTNIIYGWLLSPKPEFGIYRRQKAYDIKDNQTRIGLENTVYQHINQDSSASIDEEFLVNFSSYKTKIPSLDLERIVADNLVKAVVEGKVVFISVKPLSRASGYYSPISDDNRLLSSTHFHAFALDTLVSDKQIFIIPQFINTISIILSIIGGIIVFQKYSLHICIFIILIFNFFYILFSWILLNKFNVWLTIVDINLAAWLTLLLIWRHRIVQEKLAIDDIIMDVSYRIHERKFPVSFYLTEDPWSQLIKMTNMTLNLSRAIFMEKIENDHRLREIKALNCSIEDIQEQRRDYLRYPYTLAISENSPVLLDRPYLKQTSVEELHYLTPLVYAGEVLGFWAFTIKPDSLKDSVKFNSLARDYMFTISNILHSRKEWQKAQSIKQNPWINFMGVRSTISSINRMRESFTLLDRRIEELQEIFNDFNTCSILYDLFGRALLVNRKMEQLALEFELKPFDSTLLDVLIDVSHYDIETARIILQKIIIDHEEKTIFLRHFSTEKNYILYLKPLQIRQEANDAYKFSTNFSDIEMRGVLLEFIDVTDIKNRLSLKEQMLEHFGFQLRSDLNTISMALSLLKMPQISEEEKNFAFKSVDKKIDTIFNSLDDVEHLSDDDLNMTESKHDQCYPIDGRALLIKKIKDWETVFENRQLKVHYKLPKLLSLVYATPEGYEALIQAVLESIVEDTYDSGELWIEMVSYDRLVTLRLKNTGIGVLESLVSQAKENPKLSSQPIRNLLNCTQSIQQCQGDIRIESDAGKGSQVEVIFKKFM